MALGPAHNDPNYKAELKRKQTDPHGYAPIQAIAADEERAIRAQFKLGPDVAIDDPRYLAAAYGYRHGQLAALNAARERRAAEPQPEPQGRTHQVMRTALRLYAHFRIRHTPENAQRIAPICELLLDQAEGIEAAVNLDNAGPVLRASGLV